MIGLALWGCLPHLSLAVSNRNIWGECCQPVENSERCLARGGLSPHRRSASSWMCTRGKWLHLCVPAFSRRKTETSCLRGCGRSSMWGAWKRSCFLTASEGKSANSQFQESLNAEWLMSIMEFGEQFEKTWLWGAGLGGHLEEEVL